MESPHEGDESRYFCRIQVLAVCGHIPAALKHLSNELVFGQAISDTRQVGAPLSALSIECMAVAALFALKQHSSLQFQRSPPLDVLNRRRYSTPGTHVG